MPMSQNPWSVRVARSHVPAAGRHFDLVADSRVRAAIAKLAGVAALPRLTSRFEVTLQGRAGLHVTGRVSATVNQECVVTLEPMENEIDEPIDVVFVPAAAPPLGSGSGDVGGREIEVADHDPPETLVDDTVDLGAIATEFLILAIDPYPRRPDAVFEPATDGEEAAHPFSALAALTKPS